MLKPPAPTTYQQYCQLRLDCGYDGAFAMNEEVWNACDAEAQQSMLNQLRAGAKRHKEWRERFGGDQ